MTMECAMTTTKRLGLPALKTVEHVDLGRYLGTWYEIARFPQSFQEGCVASTANYTLRTDGLIDVLNTCRQDTLDGKERSAKGLARVVDAETNAKLQVTFFLFFWGDYWIIDLDPDYNWAVVGHPSRDYLWILCRTPQMDEGVYSGIIERLEAVGYETDRLYVTPQVGTAAD
jgi:apolipoprotein D and lipocalin family protein